jgi:hypothetical protein
VLLTCRNHRLEDTTPRKRIHLQYRLPSGSDYSSVQPLFGYFLRLADKLAAGARFRPEVLRKVKTVREETIAQLEKKAREEGEADRELARDRARKDKRDKELAALDAKGQKKYLEKEKDKEMKKAMKRSTQRH